MTIKGNDERMIAYLLGELTEAESILIEEEYLTDDEALAQLMAIEAELYDAYARNALSPERSRRFENKFLTTPEQRNRLEFSYALLRQPRPIPSRGAKPLAWAAAIFAVLTIAAVLTWKYWPVPQNSAVITQQASVTPSRVVVPFAIGGSTTRSVSDETVLVVPANADDLQITAELEREPHPPLQAVLNTPEGTEIWKSDPARPIEFPNDSHIRLEIPASGLASGHYILTLSAKNPQGNFEEIQSYSFLVRTQNPVK
jgi:hypothetical protein